MVENHRVGEGGGGGSHLDHAPRAPMVKGRLNCHAIAHDIQSPKTHIEQTWLSRSIHTATS